MYQQLRRTLALIIVLAATNCDAFVIQQQIKNAPRLHRSVYLSSSTKDTDQDFWAKQKELVSEMQEKSNRNYQQELKEKFAKRRLGLVTDTAYLGFFIFCALWCVSDNPFTALSFSFGATMGLAYAFGLGKFVETIGGSIDDVDVKGAGVGEARFAFLIILFIVVGKFRAQGLEPIPSIAGFFTYQLASLSQGLKEFND